MPYPDAGLRAELHRRPRRARGRWAPRIVSGAGMVACEDIRGRPRQARRPGRHSGTGFASGSALGAGA
eukprot:14963605-Heterocapsa_arctica.AAC.1